MKSREMISDREKAHGDVKRDLLKSVVAYAATGLLGAAVAYGATVLGRLPSRALTILPAGIHILEGPVVSCADTEFIEGRVNPYVDPEVKLPPCGVLLSKSQAGDLVQGLGAAQQFYRSERIQYFQSALARLATIEKASPPDPKLKSGVLAAIGDLEFISKGAPDGLDGPTLLKWAQTRVQGVLTDVTSEFERIKAILAKLQGGDAQARHTEFYFVVTNASDVEFYISTACNVRQGASNVGLVLEKVDRDDVLSAALVYAPMLPGRGKLLKYTPRDEKQVTTLLSSKEPVTLACALASGNTIETKKFDPTPFVARESTFASR